MKRFSVKELRQWIMETATKAIEGDSFQTGTVFYKILPGGVSAVISWSEYGDYQYEKNNPFQRFSKIEICCGQPTECAYNLEIALRITEPVSSWGNLPSDWLLWDTYMPWAKSEGLEGAFSFSQADIDDGMKSMAEIMSKRRTEYCKRNKYYG